MKAVDSRTHDEIVRLAREIVTGDLLIVDLEDQNWQASMMLLLSGWEIPENLGLIVVPVGPHLSGLWLYGRVPGVTVQATLIAEENLAALQAEVDRMHAALFPNHNEP